MFTIIDEGFMITDFWDVTLCVVNRQESVGGIYSMFRSNNNNSVA
jgi:hypothetical protein